MIKNYTSSVPVERSIAMIEIMLAKHGAPVGIAFRITTKGIDLAFKLPARVDDCRKVLIDAMAPRSRTNAALVKKVAEQAARTAWKILFDWTAAQMAMVDLAQVEMSEVFLPYLLVDSETTMFQAMAERGFKAMLTDGKKR